MVASQSAVSNLSSYGVARSTIQGTPGVLETDVAEAKGSAG
jgi:hypothetical protein